MIDMRAVQVFMRAVQLRLPTIVGVDEVAKMRRNLCLDALVEISGIMDGIEAVLDSGMSPGEKNARFDEVGPGYCKTLEGLRARFAEVFLDFPMVDFEEGDRGEEEDY